jgi:hypothetical protein
MAVSQWFIEDLEVSVVGNTGVSKLALYKRF